MLINGNKPLSPVPEINASSNLLGAGDRRQRAQLPPVLEGDVPLSMSPVASSPSATSLSAEVAGLRLLETAGLPSDSESASESTVTNASWAESAVALSAVSAHSVRRKMEPNVQMTLSEGRTKKSPRSSMLNKMNTNHTNLSRKSSRTSLGTVSSTAEVRTTESTTAEEQRSNVKQPKVTLRRAASEPPRTLTDGSAERAGSGSPPPSHTFRKQLSTSIEHATPPREKRRNAWAVNVATVANDKTGKAGKTSPQPRAANSREQSIATSASVPRLPSQRLSSSNQLERFRSQRNCARHLQLALGEDAKDAFRRALLQGTHQPRCAKLGFVGPARAGKTSTLRALSGLPLRVEEESTPGLACWALSQELLSAAPGRRWQLQDQAAASTARWDRGVAKYVADMVRPPGLGQGTSSASRQPCIDTLDPSVMKRMPVDLIARRLGETANGTPAQEEKTVVLEAYDFGGQDVYYAMHHLFLSDYGIYLACIDLSSLRLPTEETGPGPPGAGDDLEKDMEKSTQTWDALEWWLASIVVHAPNSPVAIVGTHDDCLPESSRPSIHAEVHERITAFCKKLPELNEQLHINEAGQLCFFPMDNSSMDGGKSAKTLQKAVEVMVSKLLQGALGKSIPLRWSHFWAVLQRASGTSNLGPLTKVDDLWKRSARYGFESMQELQNFLRHFHGLGALLHFSEVEELRDLVCLKPAWVGDAAAAVLTAKDKVFQGCVRHVAELKERGMLHMQLLTAVWRARPFARYHQQLVGLLQALDLLLAWGHDKQSQLQTPRGRQPATDVQKIYLVPSQLPLRPPREREVEEVASQDAVVLYFDFHGLLRRLLPTLIPRLLCSLSRVESGVQILSIYANFALFATSTQGQAQGDSLRSSGSRRTVSMLLVSVQPCGEFLRCCLRPRRGGDARLSWKNVAWLLHNFREAVSAWMPRISFRAGIRCPACTAGHAHVLDLHNVLRDEDLAVCSRSGDLLEDLPTWLLDWRQHLQRAQPGSPRTSVMKLEDDEVKKPSEGRVLHLEYLYASPLDLASLDVRAEIEALATIPGVNLTVRTATTETLAEVWRTERCPGPRVLVVAAHCAVSALAQPSLLLEDTVGHAHVLGIKDLDDLLALNGPEVAAGGKPCSAPIFDVVVVDACHSEPLASRFLQSGASCAVGCAGEVFDAAAREFLRVFLRSLAAAVSQGSSAISVAAKGAYLAAQRSVRLSPQPGLRSEADHFCFVPNNISSSTERLAPLVPLTRTSESLFSHLPPPVEDFVGRGATISIVASAFLGQRKVIWLHGKAGIGKTALMSEFCRFYAMPGDRLFSHGCRWPRARDPGSPSEAEAAAGGRATHAPLRGVQLLRVSGLGPVEVLERLKAAVQEMPRAGPATLLALDGVEESLAQRDSQAVAELWGFLGEVLADSPLRLLLTSREPRYDAPIPGKVVAIEVPLLAREDACLLLARRAHRPLFQRDLDGTCRPGGDPLALSTRRRELLQRLAQHPLATKMGDSPAEVIAAAASITPQLPSLFAHPLLQDGSGT